MTTDIINSADVLDIRDIIERIEHLRQLRQPGPVDLGDDDNELNQDELFAELASLEQFVEQFRSYGGDHEWEGDWFPVTLIRDSYFEDYAQELAEDIGAIKADAGWPNYCIDWERAARDLQMDYASGEFDGVTYWAR